MASNPSFGASELVQMVEHIAYEWEQLHRSAQLLRHRPAGQDQNGERQALIESFAIHARNLIEFLHLDRTYPTDVRATDFLASGHPWPTTSSSGLAGLMAKVFVQANKQIAHLSIDRARAAPMDFDWAIDDIIDELEKKMALFVRAMATQWSTLASRLRNRPVATRGYSLPQVMHTSPLPTPNQRPTNVSTPVTRLHGKTCN
jgi:hypothetical protein